MKKLVIVFNMTFVLLSSCAIQKKGVVSYNDDVYANPKEDRIEDARIAAEKKQLQEAADKRYNDSIAAVKKAQKEKDDANPYYKDREFKYDDYYDYEYATRVKRFNNNIDGLSYYDNYYTNSYWYNQNPYNYGVSVYNGYSWWGSSYNSYSYNPSVNFYSNWGWGCNTGYGYNGYNPYMAGYMQGYNNGFTNGYYGNYYGYGNPYNYNPFGYGNYGYGYPYGYGGYGYNNWGYFNSLDLNSSFGFTYGFRSSHGGGNSRRTSNPGVTGKRDSYYEKYMSDVAEQQSHTVKFSELPTTRVMTSEPTRVNANGTPIGTGGIKQVRDNGIEAPTRVNSNPVKTVDENTPIRNYPIKENHPVKEQTAPTRFNDASSQPVKQNPIRNTEPVKHQMDATPRFEAPVRQYSNPSSPNVPNNNGGGAIPNNNGVRRPK